MTQVIAGLTNQVARRLKDNRAQKNEPHDR